MASLDIATSSAETKNKEQVQHVGEIPGLNQDGDHSKKGEVPPTATRTTSPSPIIFSDQRSSESKEPMTSPKFLDPVAEPKVKRTVQYMTRKNVVVYIRSFNEEEKSKRTHNGAVFEIFDVKITNEGRYSRYDSDSGPEDGPPIVSKFGRQYIRIYSPAVLNALQAVVNYYPEYQVIGDRMQIYEPYAILVHHWDELKEYHERFRPEIMAKNEDSKDCCLTDTYEHLGYILDFLEDMWGDKIRKEKERWAQPTLMVSFEMLWFLLRPGIDVFLRLRSIEISGAIRRITLSFD